MINNKNYKVDPASLSIGKLLYDFAKKMKFDLNAQGNKSTRDRTLKKFFKSPALRISASSISKTVFLSFNPNDICKRLKLLIQEKRAWNNSDLINQELVVIIDKFLEYKCMTPTQNKNFLFKNESYLGYVIILVIKHLLWIVIRFPPI